MSYVKTAKDIFKEALDLRCDKILNFLKHKDSLQFKPGDILIKMLRKHTDGEEWAAEVVSSANTVPKKYLYAFENELGIGYVKAFLSDGTTAPRPSCLTEFNFDYCKFVLDPEYVDHILIGGQDEFSPASTYKDRKKFREKALANNKKLLIPADVASRLSWIETLDVGCEFYFGYDVPDMVTNKYRVVATSHVPVNSFASWQQDFFKKEFALKAGDMVKCVEVTIIKHRWENVGATRKYSIDDLRRGCITEKEPFPLSEGDK